MAVGFTDKEKTLIKEKLMSSAKQCLEQYGVKKTTVEMLVKKVGISKGAFYLFFPSKEILFFYVLEEYQKKLFQPIFEKKIDAEKYTSKKQNLIDILVNMYQGIKDSFILTIIQNNEFEYLFRKIPPELLAEHHSFDQLVTSNLLEYLQITTKHDSEVISSAFRAIFMTMLHQEEIGKDYYDEAMKMLITGLAELIVEEK